MYCAVRKLRYKFVKTICMAFKLTNQATVNFARLLKSAWLVSRIAQCAFVCNRWALKHSFIIHCALLQGSCTVFYSKPSHKRLEIRDQIWRLFVQRRFNDRWLGFSREPIDFSPNIIKSQDDNSITMSTSWIPRGSTQFVVSPVCVRPFLATAWCLNHLMSLSRSVRVDFEDKFEPGVV